MHAIVGAALKQRVLVIILGPALMVGGLFAYGTLNIEAYPAPVPPLVDVITQNTGQSSEEIERMGVVLIFLIQWVFLGNLLSALIVSATIPFSTAASAGETVKVATASSATVVEAH